MRRGQVLTEAIELVHNLCDSIVDSNSAVDCDFRAYIR
jgi:hypothetical protein